MKTIKNLIILSFLACATRSKLEATYPLLPKPGRDETVVCLHGFMRNHWSMGRIENFMTNEGFRVYNHNYPSRDKEIEAHGYDLTLILRSIASNHPGRPIHFITHSMGALVARAAINHPNCPLEAKTGKAVLFAPPNQGSAFGRSLRSLEPVRWAVGDQAGRQLIEKDSFKDLGDFPDSMDVLIIAGEYDGKVAIEETRLDRPHELYVAPRGHSLIMYDRPSIRKAKDFLIGKRVDE
ncbi:MAG: alpha/beta fold hydrolase [Chlamydiia bacterium]|nr:alpha/beta fold hydrolase [Chlamydiia bacterium]